MIKHRKSRKELALLDPKDILNRAYKGDAERKPFTYNLDTKLMEAFYAVCDANNAAYGRAIEGLIHEFMERAKKHPDIKGSEDKP